MRALWRYAEQYSKGKKNKLIPRVVKYLLENGATCDRDTFEGERCLYGALTSEIRELLLDYNFTKRIDETQPFAAALSFLYNDPENHHPDIIFRVFVPSSEGIDDYEDFYAHRFILSARSSWFRTNFSTRWRGSKRVKLARNLVHPATFRTVLQYIYTGELGAEINSGTLQENLSLLCRKMELDGLEARYNDRIALGSADRAQIHRKEVERDKQEFANVQEDLRQFVQAFLLQDRLHVNADESDEEDEDIETVEIRESPEVMSDVYLQTDEGTLYPAHRAILSVRSEYFETMFSGPFMEGHNGVNLNGEDDSAHQAEKNGDPMRIEQPTSIIQVAIKDNIFEKIVEFIYTDRCDIEGEFAYSILLAADMLLLDRLKSIASIAITSQREPTYDIYELLRTAWAMKNDRIEQFCCKW